MIKFFRKIRHKFLLESRFNKYLLYAIGEIILVVIGILIALQINNWNTESQQRNLEVKILKEIQSNLSFDLIEIREDISVMDSVNMASIEVVEYLKNHDEPSEKFNYNVAKVKVAPHFNPNKSGYELLTSKGVELVVNDSLRIAISDLYESTYPYYKQYENERISFKENFIQPMLLKYCEWLNDENRYYLTTFNITKDDFIKMKADDAFLKMIQAAKFENYIVRFRAEQKIEAKILRLQEIIAEELNSKQ